jgi:hypothetical protein
MAATDHIIRGGIAVNPVTDEIARVYDRMYVNTVFHWLSR